MKLVFNNEGLIPAIVQDADTKNALMLGYMNQVAYDETVATGKVVFYSRSRQERWMKGETSGHFLQLVDMKVDCDNDALLVTARPLGPTCHKGTVSCWGNPKESTLDYLEATIAERKLSENEESYVTSLFRKGINKIAQKVGEEAVEVVIEAKDSNDELFLEESADLLFHYLILLQAKGYKLKDVLAVLDQRRK